MSGVSGELVLEPEHANLCEYVSQSHTLGRPAQQSTMQVLRVHYREREGLPVLGPRARSMRTVSLERSELGPISENMHRAMSSRGPRVG